MKKRVVITGMGVLSPIGNNVIEYWNGLKNGKNGIKNITLFDTELYDVKIAGEVDLSLEEYFEKKELNRLDRFTAFGIIAADQAIKQSNFLKNNIANNRVGVIVGSGIGGIGTFETQHKKLLKNPRFVSPFFIPSMISDILPGHISIKYNFTGINYSIASACSTGNHAIGDAFRMIQNGMADIIVTGGSEAAITPMSVAGFSNMKALTKNGDINSASRPFDVNRDGFVLGEGAGILILEDYECAKRRNAKILCEIIGYSATADGHHITTPHPNGNGATLAMETAITDAQISKQSIQYINAHGTSTPYNDKIETKAIKEVFKSHSNNLLVSSIKSMTGHLLGASGGIESIASILSIQHGYVTPTINYLEPDPECDLNYVPNTGIKINVDFVLSNSFGFGGHNAVLIFKNYTN